VVGVGEGALEVEDKYDAPADATMPDLSTLPGVATVETTEHRLEATYYDSPSLALADLGITLRRRTGGDDEGWHLKVPYGDGRHEMALPLSVGAQAVPQQIRHVVATLVRDQPLEPVARLITERTVHELLDSEGHVLAEVADDRVAPEDPQSGWREWEVELVVENTDLPAAAADAFAACGATPSTSANKLARAIGSGPAGPELPTRKKAPASEVVVARLEEQRRELLLRDPAVRLDLDDAVHKMRVAVRRLRTALATYRPFLDRSVTEPIRDELAWLGGVLGEARDAEVMREHLTDAAEDAGSPVAVRTVVDSEQTEAYRSAHAAVLEAFGSERYLRLLDGLKALTDVPPLTADADRKLKKAMTKRVRHDWSRLADRIEADEDNRDLHAARRAGKRVRYAIEPLVPAYGKVARRLVKKLKKLQDALGEHHDAVTAQDRLRDLADKHPEQAFALGELRVHEEEAALTQEDAALATWDSVRRPRRRRWLG
jgi:CHAD domain-containing protein